MGYREYARHRQVTLRAVQKAIEAGRIKVVVVDGKSKIDSEQADRDWVTNTDPAKQSLLYSAGPDHGDSLLREPQAGLATGAGAARTAVPASSGDDDEPPDEPAAGGATDDDTKAYRAERAQRERIRREREQLELDQLRGSLVDKAEVARLRFTEFRALRDALGNVGARIKDAVAAESDALRCEQLIDREISARLADFADQVLARGVTAEADDEDDAAD